jgi:molecular chaperone DnaK (HSP70)
MNLKYVKSIPFLGGRNFDESICDLAKNKFLLQFGEPFPESVKTKRRLMESILKARKQLTVNDDDNITLESIINDEDFTFTLTREIFEQIISNHLECFTKNFLDFIKEYKEATEIEELLPNLPDISKWNRNNVDNISSLFCGCSYR